MSSQDFYLTPGTLSNMYIKAIEAAGYPAIKGWRSMRQDVEVLVADDRVLSLTVGKGNQVEIRELQA